MFTYYSNNFLTFISSWLSEPYMLVFKLTFLLTIIWCYVLLFIFLYFYIFSDFRSNVYYLLVFVSYISNLAKKFLVNLNFKKMHSHSENKIRPYSQQDLKSFKFIITILISVLCANMFSSIHQYFISYISIYFNSIKRFLPSKFVKLNSVFGAKHTVWGLIKLKGERFMLLNVRAFLFIYIWFFSFYFFIFLGLCMFILSIFKEKKTKIITFSSALENKFFYLFSSAFRKTNYSYNLGIISKKYLKNFFYIR